MIAIPVQYTLSTVYTQNSLHVSEPTNLALHKTQIIVIISSFHWRCSLIIILLKTKALKMVSQIMLAPQKVALIMIQQPVRLHQVI